MATLFVVSTPIGNLKDISERAKKVLSTTSIILCEDTRITRKLLNLLQIDAFSKKLIPYFDHNERKKYREAIEILEEGSDVALVSDAGMPLLSDPGFVLVREIRRMQKVDGEKNFLSGKTSTDVESIKIEVLPGPDSITTALVSSGLPTDRFTFLGYLPRKPSDRRKLFKAVKRSNESIKSTYIAFETKHRLKSSLDAMKKVLGGKFQIALCKELTKMHESVKVGTLDEIIGMIEKSNMRGEIVLVFNLNV